MDRIAVDAMSAGEARGPTAGAGGPGRSSCVGAQPGGTDEMRAVFESMMATLLGTLVHTAVPTAAPSAPRGSEAQGETVTAETALVETALPGRQMPVALPGSTSGARGGAQDAGTISLPQAQAPAIAPEGSGGEGMTYAGTTTSQTAAGTVQTSAGFAGQIEAAASAQPAGPTLAQSPEAASDGSQAASSAANKTADGGETPIQGPATPQGAEPAAQVSAARGSGPVAQESSTTASPMDQIADRVQVTFARGENQATIRLNPEELGRVNIRLQMQDGTMRLSIQAEQLNTQHLLTRQLSELRQTLEGQGIKLGDVAVTLAPASRTVDGLSATDVVQPTTHVQAEMQGDPNQHNRQAGAPLSQDGAFGHNGGDARRGQPRTASTTGVDGIQVAPGAAATATSQVGVDMYA